ncbi:MoaD/ThiS family protein [Tsuneonella sp. CC-YZS046]|uniref:MoaD/ThiS family protein n=1 Tax=Tsuneonella sp. CC-YZS046 TaxID=3042152 RepID=UPI002D787AF5|nr:MoaD/ThiS family protein [Tsuneonella sp. CC-YZS046]WRO67356.1 MoaD/ThiS family protein [Tsuneonella sp. CC-YZS046]
MPLKLLFLGKLADLAGGREQAVDPADKMDWAGLMACLAPDLADALETNKVRVAVNGTLVSDTYALLVADGDEIAFLPPVSGG